MNTSSLPVLKRFHDDAFDGATIELRQTGETTLELCLVNDEGRVEIRKSCPSVEAADKMAADLWEYVAEHTCAECGHSFDPGEPHAADGVCGECSFDDEKLELVLHEALEEYPWDQSDVRVETYESAGLMTNDRGVVLKIGKRKFQITIVEA